MQLRDSEVPDTLDGETARGLGLFCLHSEFTEIRSNLYPPGKLAGYRDPEIRIPVFTRQYFVSRLFPVLMSACL